MHGLGIEPICEKVLNFNILTHTSRMKNYNCLLVTIVYIYTGKDIYKLKVEKKKWFPLVDLVCL